MFNLNFLKDILVNMLKKEKKRAADALAGKPITPRHSQHRSASTNAVPHSNDRSSSSTNGHHGRMPSSNTSSRAATSQSGSEEKVKRQVCK